MSVITKLSITKSKRGLYRLTTLLISLLTTTSLLFGLAQPALASSARCRPDGGPYDCKTLLPHGWHNITSLTYCFPTGNHEVKWSDKTNQGSTVPPDYQESVKAGANVWNTTPGIHVKLSVAACSSKTDIRIYAVHLGNRAGGEMAAGGCSQTSDGYCYAYGGQMELNIDIPNNDQYAASWLHATVHEFGHVVGLDHPTAPNCSNKCPDPVMSYGSCPATNDCSNAPNYDDIAGVQQIYRWPATSNGGGGCDLTGSSGTSSTSTSSSTSLVNGVSVPSTNTVNAALPPLNPTIPNPGSISITPPTVTPPNPGSIGITPPTVTVPPTPPLTVTPPTVTPPILVIPEPSSLVPNPGTGIVIPEPTSLVPSPGTGVVIPEPSSLVPEPGTGLVIPEPTTLVPAVSELIDGPDITVSRPEPLPLPVVGGSVVDGALNIVKRLADPRVDAYETLAATAGTIRHEMEWVFITAGVSDPTVLLPAQCLAL